MKKLILILSAIGLMISTIASAQSSEDTARAKFNQGKYEEAAQICDAAASLTSNSAERDRLYALARKCRECQQIRTAADRAYNNQDYETALTQYRRLVANVKNPRDPVATRRIREIPDLIAQQQQQRQQQQQQHAQQQQQQQQQQQSQNRSQSQQSQNRSQAQQNQGQQGDGGGVDSKITGAIAQRQQSQGQNQGQNNQSQQDQGQQSGGVDSKITGAIAQRQQAQQQQQQQGQQNQGQQDQGQQGGGVDSKITGAISQRQQAQQQQQQQTTPSTSQARPVTPSAQNTPSASQQAAQQAAQQLQVQPSDYPSQPVSRTRVPFQLGVGFSLDMSGTEMGLMAPVELRIGNCQNRFSLIVGGGYGKVSGRGVKNTMTGAYSYEGLDTPILYSTDFFGSADLRMNFIRDESIHLFLGAGFDYRFNREGFYRGVYVSDFNTDTADLTVDNLYNPTNMDLRFTFGLNFSSTFDIYVYGLHGLSPLWNHDVVDANITYSYDSALGTTRTANFYQDYPLIAGQADTQWRFGFGLRLWLFGHDI